MRKSLGLFVFLVVLLGFQNCQKSRLDPNSQVDTLDESSQTKLLVTEYPAVVFWDYNREQQVLVRVRDGRMIQSPIETASSSLVAAGFEESHTCLQPALLQKLQFIIQSSKLCPPAQPEGGELCTMLYQYPYASLSSSSESLHLGERKNGCEQPLDLCGDQASQLQNLTAELIEKYQSSESCPNL